MKVQRKFKMQAHISSRVVMDVAAFKVSHSVGTDIDATTLRAHARARSSSTHRGDGTLHMGSIHEKAHILPDTHIATISISAGPWRKCRRRFNIQTLTFCGTKIMSTRTAAGQFKGQFKGAMDKRSGKDQDAGTPFQRRCHGYCSLRS